MKTQVQENYRDIDFGFHDNPLGIKELRYNDATNMFIIFGGGDCCYAYHWDDISLQEFNRVYLQQLCERIRRFDSHTNATDNLLRDFFISLHSINHQVGNDRFNCLSKFPDLIKVSIDRETDNFSLDNPQELINLIDSY
jgi:hypothetical protein